jgi:FkbH-like protein
LTTRRRSVAELLALIEDESWISLTVSLADRFGDNGLISVLIARASEQTLEIDTWLMSCRVLKRGVEQFLLNTLCRLARDRGVTKIYGQYIPTAKNSLVRNHYQHLGFRQLSSDETGGSQWELEVNCIQAPLNNFIKESLTNASLTT